MELTRTNYFGVKDVEEFKTWCAQSGLKYIEQESSADKLATALDVKFGANPRLVGFIADEGIPSERQGADGEIHDFDCLDELVGHIADGHVAVVMEAGFDRERYCHGWAFAINSKGEQREVTLRSIYDMAKELGELRTEAEY